MNKQELWNQEYQRKGLPTSRMKANSSSHVEEFIRFLVSRGTCNGNIIDLGCGYGSDARGFAQQGFFVYACDISDTALSVAQQKAKEDGLIGKIKFSLTDISLPWEYPDDLFDAAFDGTTFINLITENEINNYFEELKRTLKNQAYGQIVTPILPDEFYQKLYDEQRSNIVVCPSGIIQRTYTEEQIINLLQEHFVIQYITLIQKKNRMYGYDYSRCLIRVIFQNKKAPFGR